MFEELRIVDLGTRFSLYGKMTEQGVFGRGGDGVGGSAGWHTPTHLSRHADQVTGHHSPPPTLNKTTPVPDPCDSTKVNVPPCRQLIHPLCAEPAALMVYPYPLTVSSTSSIL